MKNNKPKQPQKQEIFIAPTPKQVWNFEEPDQLRAFIEQLEMAMGNDQALTAGLILLMQTITAQESFVFAKDICDDVCKELFIWTLDFDKASRAYCERIAESDFLYLSGDESAREITSISGDSI